MKLFISYPSDQKELAERRKDQKRLEGLLASDEKRWGMVGRELQELREKYGDKRRTRIGGWQGSAYRHRSRPALFKRGLIKKGVRRRVEQLMRKYTGLGEVDRQALHGT